LIKLEKNDLCKKLRSITSLVEFYKYKEEILQYLGEPKPKEVKKSG